MREALKDYVNGETWSGEWQWEDIMCGGHKKKWNLRQDIYVLCYAILRSLVSLENLKNTWREELILVKLQAINMLQRQPAFTVSNSTIKELEQGVKYAQS